MDNKRFWMGMGIGMVTGSALGMMAAPRRRNDGKKTISRALKGMGDVIDDVTAALGR